MNKAKRKKLEKKGWKVGTAEDFLRLSPEESRDIELKLAVECHDIVEGTICSTLSERR
jgi:hypothetical protein